MTDFIPPYPKRHKKTLGPIDMLKYIRRDVLSIWPEDAFNKQFMSFKIINRSIFIANHPDVVRYILSTNHDNYQRKNPLMRKALQPLMGDALLISDGAAWEKHLELLVPMFSLQKIEQYCQIMIETTEDHLQQWALLNEGDTISVFPEMIQLTAKIMCRILFGRQVTAEQAAQVVDSFADYRASMEQMDINSFIGLPSWVPGSKTSKNKTTNAAKAVHDLFDTLIVEAEESGESTSLVAQFVELRNNGILSGEQMRNELAMLFMAGHESTASTLSWALYLISQCPEVEDDLHAEVDAILGERSATFGDVGDLIYTRAILDETMRLYPSFPMLLREAIADDVIRKREVPAGSIMIIVPWLLHRHQQYWEYPDHFIPERFLEEDPELMPDPFAYIPFSAGPRACLGKYFGIAQTTLCLAIISQFFRLRTAENQVVETECRLTLRPKGDLPMLISLR